jgi:sRNA-binding protein
MCGMANPSWSKVKYAAREVHLDQDTAGRLLESMGDHARREMIVRVTQVTRQNPAYRPLASDATTSDGILSEVVCFSEQRAT